LQDQALSGRSGTADDRQIVAATLTLPPSAFITAWNNRSHPFVWTKPADEVLNKANRRRPQTRGTRG